MDEIDNLNIDDETLRDIQKAEILSEDEVYDDACIENRENLIEKIEETEDDEPPLFNSEDFKVASSEQGILFEDTGNEKYEEHVTALSTGVVSSKDRDYLDRGETIKHIDNYELTVKKNQEIKPYKKAPVFAKTISKKKSCFLWLVPLSFLFVLIVLVITMLLTQSAPVEISENDKQLIEELSYQTGKNALFISEFNDLASRKKVEIEKYIRSNITKPELDIELLEIKAKEKAIYAYYIQEIKTERAAIADLIYMSKEFMDNCIDTTEILLKEVQRKILLDDYNQAVSVNNEKLEKINEYIRNEARKLNTAVVVENNIVKIDLSCLNT